MDQPTNKELLRKALSDSSYRKLADELGTSFAQLSDIDKERRPMTPAIAAKLAEKAGHDPLVALLEAEQLQAKKEDDKELFTRLKKKAALMAAASTLVVGVIAPQHQTNLIDIPYHSAKGISQYILC